MQGRRFRAADLAGQGHILFLLMEIADRILAHSAPCRAESNYGATVQYDIYIFNYLWSPLFQLHIQNIHCMDCMETTETLHVRQYLI